MSNLLIFRCHPEASGPQRVEGPLFAFGNSVSQKEEALAVRRSMNRFGRISATVMLLVAVLASVAHAQEKKTAAGEEFFMVASLDQSKSQLLLKRPTEVTLLAKVTPKTQFLDEKNKPIQLSDLRAGDTVWAVITGGNDNTTVTRLRKGPMTVADLHKYYLDYPEVK